MALRDDIKNVLESATETVEDLGADRLIKEYAIKSFTKKILNDARCGVKGNTLRGTFEFGSLASSDDAEKLITGEKKKWSFFKKSTVWKLTVSPESNEMIRINAIKKYASKENISLSFEIRHTNPMDREFDIDISEFPRITITANGKHYSGNMNIIRFGELKLFIHYSMSL